MVKSMIPEVIPGAFCFKQNARGIIEGVIVLTIAQVKAVNICFITPQTFLNTVLLSYRPECYNPWTTRIQIAKTFTLLHVVFCNPTWLQTFNLSSSYMQRTSVYCTSCDSLRTSARQTDALSHMANRCTITRPSSSKTKTYHVTSSKPMKMQNIGCNLKYFITNEKVVVGYGHYPLYFKPPLLNKITD